MSNEHDNDAVNNNDTSAARSVSGSSNNVAATDTMTIPVIADPIGEDDAAKPFSNAYTEPVETMLPMYDTDNDFIVWGPDGYVGKAKHADDSAYPQDGRNPGTRNMVPSILVSIILIVVVLVGIMGIVDTVREQHRQEEMVQKRDAYTSQQVEEQNKQKTKEQEERLNNEANARSVMMRLAPVLNGAALDDAKELLAQNGLTGDDYDINTEPEGKLIVNQSNWRIISVDSGMNSLTKPSITVEQITSTSEQIKQKANELGSDIGEFAGSIKNSYDEATKSSTDTEQ